MKSINMFRTFFISATFILVFIFYDLNSALAWTEPVQIDNGLYLGASRVVAVGETLHVIATQPPRSYYLYSRDNGQTWSEPIMPIDTSLEMEDPYLNYSDGILHLVWKERTFYPQLFYSRSLDGGRSWSRPAQVFVNSASRVLSFPTLAVNGDSLYLACALDYGYPFLRSFDAGLTWQDSTIIDWGVYSILQDPHLGYSEGRLHFIYPMGVSGDSFGYEIYYKKSTDFGVTWSDRTIISPAEPIPNSRDSQIPSAYADSAGRILVAWMDYANGSMCGITGDIFYRVSLDNSESWQNVGSLTNTQSGRYSCCLIEGDRFFIGWDDAWLLGCEHPKEAISSSTDLGQTWDNPAFISGPSVVSEGIPALVYTVQGADTVLHYFFTTREGPSHLMYMRSEPFVSVADSPPISRPQIFQIKVYPSVFNSFIIICLENIIGGQANMEIYSILGQKVWLKTVYGSSEKVIWDAKDMNGNGISSGIYIIRAMTGNQIASVKITYLK